MQVVDMINNAVRKPLSLSTPTSASEAKLANKKCKTLIFSETCSDYSLQEKLMIKVKECEGLRESQHILIKELDKKKRLIEVLVEVLANKPKKQHQDHSKDFMPSREVQHLIDDIDDHLFVMKIIRQDIYTLDSLQQNSTTKVFGDEQKSLWVKQREIMIKEYQRNILKLQAEVHSRGGWFSDQDDCTSDMITIDGDIRHKASKRKRAKSSIKVPQVNNGKQNCSESNEHESAMIQQHEEMLLNLLCSLKTMQISTGKSENLMRDTAIDNLFHRKNGGDNLAAVIGQGRQGYQANRENSCGSNFYEHTPLKIPVNDYSLLLTENMTQFSKRYRPSSYVDQPWSLSEKATFQPASVLLSSTPCQLPPPLPMSRPLQQMPALFQIQPMPVLFNQQSRLLQPMFAHAEQSKFQAR